MSKKNFAIDIIPLNNFLIGFSFQKGAIAEDHSIHVEEFTLGFGIINLRFIRTYK
jgi:hypothetical protein